MWWHWPRRGELYLTSTSITLLAEDKVVTCVDYLGLASRRQQLIQLLHLARSRKITSLGIWLGGGIAEIGVLQPMTGKQSHRDLVALLNAQLGFASVSLSPVICLSKPLLSGQRFWAALPSELHNELEGLAREHRFTIDEIAPLSTAVIQRESQSKSAASAAQGLLILMIESDGVTLIQRSRMLSTDSGYLGSSIHRYLVSESFAEILDRIAIQAGSEAINKCFITASENFNRVVLSEQGWRNSDLTWLRGLRGLTASR